MGNSESLLTLVNYFLILGLSYATRFLTFFGLDLADFQEVLKKKLSSTIFCNLGLELSLSKFFNKWLEVDEGSSLHFFYWLRKEIEEYSSK